MIDTNIYENDLNCNILNKYDAENLYDKLSYSSFGKSSTNNSSLNYSNQKPKSKQPKKEAESLIIYEEINQFSLFDSRPNEIKAKKIHNYETLNEFCSSSSVYTTLSACKTSSVVKRLNTNANTSINSSFSHQKTSPIIVTSKKSIYKHQYTVNEIVQNAKKFKQQAIEQEILNKSKNAVESTQKKTKRSAGEFLKSEQAKSSVSIIKQLFESKFKTQQTMSSNVKKQNQEHTYMNQKIYNPIIV